MALDIAIDFISNAHNLIDNGYYLPCKSTNTAPLLSSLKTSFIIMGELKLATPLGNLTVSNKIEHIVHKLGLYFDAISILTEPTFFRGCLSYLKMAAQYGKPVLMKDFIIDKKQIDASGAASTILLIKKFVETDNLGDMITYTHRIGKEVILEVDNEIDFLNSLDTNADYLAINNRNLTNFTIDVNKTRNLLDEYQPDKKVFAFSGYTDKTSILEVKDAGAYGVLIGSHLTRVQNLGDYVQTLKEVLNH
ncbi:MAG: hypothetical protein INQ03_20210 [Candidatus Heimdallarchaeota archaeon]|nr:hypothetical protein [Candidatus Heimdallarchaeota archaeon]